MICFLEKNREEKSNSYSWAGHRVSGFECAETFLKGTAKDERRETALVCKNQNVWSEQA